MKKWITYILLMLVMVSIGVAIELCESVEKPTDLPCMIVSTWAYGDCNATQALVYNSTPSLIATRNFTSYGVTTRCNFSWNYTAPDSYFWNTTSGDTGGIVIENEVDQMASLAVTLFVMVLTSVMFILPYKLDFSSNKLANYMMKKASILFGMFLLSLDTVIVVTIADNFGLGVSSELFRYLWIINWSIYLMMIYTFWTTLTGALELWKELAENRRMGTD